MNEIKGHRKYVVVLKFLENIEGAFAPSLPLVSYANAYSCIKVTDIHKLDF